MQRFESTVALAVLLAVAIGCDGGSSTSSGEVQYTEIRVNTDGEPLPLGATAPCKATARRSDGTEVDLSESVQWSSSDPSVADFSTDPGHIGLLVAKAEGTTEITATYKDVIGKATLTVGPPVVAGLEITPADLALSRFETVQLSAMGVLTDGTRQDLTSTVTWSVGDSAVLGLSAVAAEAGQVTARSVGTSSVGAAFGEIRASTNAEVTCTYPPAGTSIVLDQPLPAVSWAQAYQPDGSRAPFSVEDFHCTTDYDDYTSILFILSAGWCSVCPRYIRAVDAASDDLIAAGAFIVYVESQTRQHTPANTDTADEHFRTLIADGSGLRVGDADTQPTAMVFDAHTNSFPNAYIVRRTDMSVVAIRSETPGGLDPLEVVSNLNREWNKPRCGPEDEEDSEPNNSALLAGSLAPGDDFTGGICDSEPDYYNIGHAGEWRLDLEFLHETGDLDVFVWDTRTNQAMRDAQNNKIGSATNDDNESFTFTGPAFVAVIGYGGATAPYHLRLTAL